MLPPVTPTFPEQLGPALLALASALWAAAVFGLAVPVAHWLTCDRGDRTRHTAVEVRRRRSLRAASRAYRWFEPLVDAWAIRTARLPAGLRGWVARTLGIAGATPSGGLPGWTPDEWLATRAVEGAGFGVGVAALAAVAGSGFGAVGLIPILAAAYVLFQLVRVHGEARRRLASIRRSLPLAIELTALMMEAGALFPEALRTLARDLDDQPIGRLFATILEEMDLGLPRRETLARIRALYRIDELSELIAALNDGEELGSPIREVLRVQAQQLRVKRSQRIEAAAARAQLNLVFPGAICMLASLLLIVAPILLPVFQSGSFFAMP